MMLAEERILVDFLLNSDERKINRKETLLLYYLQVIFFVDLDLLILFVVCIGEHIIFYYKVLLFVFKI